MESGGREGNGPVAERPPPWTGAICISSAVRTDLSPGAGGTMRLMARWFRSIGLFKCLLWQTSILMSDGFLEKARSGLRKSIA